MFTVESAAVAELKVKDRKRYEYICHIERGKLTFECRIKNTVPKLKRIRAMVSLRNNSIFAHGLAPVETGDYMKFQKFVVELFMEFCTLEKIDFTELSKQMEWVSPLDSSFKFG